MDNMQLPGLHAEAIRLELRGFSGLRKRELFEVIQGASNQVTNLLDQPVPNINIQYYGRAGMSGQGLKEVKEMSEGSQWVITAIEEMLGLRKPSLTESKIGDEWKDFVWSHRQLPRFAAHESASALKVFTRPLRIEGAQPQRVTPWENFRLER